MRVNISESSKIQPAKPALFIVVSLKRSEIHKIIVIQGVSAWSLKLVVNDNVPGPSYKKGFW